LMFFVRQNATHKVVFGPAVAVADGFTPVTTLDISTADEAEAILHDNGTVVDISGYTWAAIATADGYYHLTLQAAISGTVGHLTILINDDSLVYPLRADFTVVEEAVYDQFYAGSASGALQPTTAGRTLDILATGEAAANVTHIDGQATSGNNATLNLKQLNIVNAAGVGMIVTGTTIGLDVNATGGIAVDVDGTTGGMTVTANNGNAVIFSATGGGGDGFAVDGDGSGSGMRSTGGATGSGLSLVGGASSGFGFDVAAGGGDSDAAAFVGQGSGAGVAITGGATGHGLYCLGGATSGDGINAVGQTLGDGMTLVGNGASQYGLNADIQGNLSGSVGSMGADGITAASIADDAFSSEHFATGAFTADAYAADAFVAATFATNSLTADALATDAVDEIADGVWDELLTAATHNIATSAGRRLRDIASNVVWTGDVVSSTVNTLTLDATASAVDGSYDPSVVIITGGTGEGQIRSIYEYFGSGGGNGNPARTLILDRDWKVEPDATSKATISAVNGSISTNEGQLRAATSTLLTLNSLAPTTDNILNGQTIQLRAGTGQDQSALVLSYDGTNKQVTVKALAVTPDATTSYQILPVGQSSLEAIQGDTQSATDFKDFVDAGYDPSTNFITGISATATNLIADTVFSRSMSNVEDTAGDHTLCALVLSGLESGVVGTTWTILKTDGSTTFLTKTVGVDASASPIVSVG
jgi:hypothetical protein